MQTHFFGLSGGERIAEGIEDVAPGGLAQDVVAVPQRVEQEYPGGEAFAFAAGAENRAYAVRIGNFLDTRLTRYELAETRPVMANPLSHRHRKAPFARKGFGLGQPVREPSAQQILALPVPHLQLVAQTEGGSGDDWIEQRGAALDPMRH